MNDRQLAALLDAVGANEAEDESDHGVTHGAIECDGLRASRTEDGYAFETPGVHRAGLSEPEFREAAAQNPWFVSNWYYWEAIGRTEADRALLRWIEHAPVEAMDDTNGRNGTNDTNDTNSTTGEHSVPERYEALAEGGGVTRTWGQLAITAELGEDGHRTYHVRHEADADAEFAALDVHADPLDARRIVKYDDDGQYRPLKTAPTLSTGWAFTDLDGRALARLLDIVYPATVANWYAKCRGELDVSHYRETAERQTGIYDVVDELPAEAVEWLAEACCVDSQCLKRRMWDEDAETELDAPRGDGVFPCREPCSLVVAAARKWTLLEREEPRTYEFELTPSEKEQVEELVDAVADGEADEVREADFAEGANRYRARYLRAKRMDEEARLCGVPTDVGGEDREDAGDGEDREGGEDEEDGEERED